jgi:multiple antibiotic resistance protein
MPHTACLVVTGFLMGFALIGQWLFTLLGITLPAIQLAGALVLFLVALDMLRRQRSGPRNGGRDCHRGDQGRYRHTSLAVPMWAGPATISNVILLEA